MSRKSISYVKSYEHSDFTDLLDELQGKKESIEMIDGEATLAAPSLMVSACAYEESKERHRIMSNQKIKYLYSRNDSVIHDKHCDNVKDILDEDLLWTEEYLSNLKPCPECMIQAYVSAGAKDSKELETYLGFFEKTKMTIDQIRNVYVENGMKTRISIDTMTVWHKEDTWRIKSLPKKGHVQLYHNNYAVRKKGVREFTQGFHIQSPMCADTDIGYALSIIKNYEYKPEEYALHSGKLNKSEKMRARQCQAEKMEKISLPLEVLLGEKTAEQTLWQKVKSYISSVFKKKTFFELNNFQLVSEQGYPKNQTICIYIWKDKNEQLFWQTGIYNQKLKQFSVRYGTTVYAINEDKVIAWKKMNADAVALEIIDRRNQKQ